MYNSRRFRRRFQWSEFLEVKQTEEKLRQWWKSGLAGTFILTLAVTLYFSDSSQAVQNSQPAAAALTGGGPGRRLLATNTTNHAEEGGGHGVEWESCDWELAHSPYAWLFNHLVFIFVIFVALAIICDDFFVPSLEAISEKLNLSEDVAGATFMAAGSSAPELFSSVAGVIQQSDVGVGTIVGSAVFNLLIIIALTAALAGQVLELDWRPLARDSFFYAMSIGCFIGFAWDGLFTHYESVILLLLYVMYIILMVFNPRIMTWMGTWSCACTKRVEPVEDGDKEKTAETQLNGTAAKDKDVPNGDRRMSLTGGHAKRLSILHHEHEGDHHFHHKRGSIAGALMMTAPRSRVDSHRRDSGFHSNHGGVANSNDTMRTEVASNGIRDSGGGGRPKNGSLTQVECIEMQGSTISPDGGRESRTESVSSDDQLLPAVTVQRPSALAPLPNSPTKAEAMASGNQAKSPLSSPPKLPPIEDQEVETNGRAGEENTSDNLECSTHAAEASGPPSEVEGVEDEEEEGPTMNLCPCLPCCPLVRTSPPEAPKEDDEKKALNWAKFVLKWVLFVPSFPFLCLFSWTIPDCSKPKYKKWYLVSFLVSVFWIAALSFGMVTLVGRSGCITNVDSYVMGVLVIAVGTSVPDCLSSILVARDGYGDMAVSNAIGSNVFDINLGLGAPFLIRILIDHGAPIVLLDTLEMIDYKAGLMPIVPHAKFGFILLLILIIAVLIFYAVRFKLNKWVGISFVCMYIIFLAYTFTQERYCKLTLHQYC